MYFWSFFILGCLCELCLLRLTITEDHVIDVKIPPIKLNMGSQTGSLGTVGIVTMT